MVVHVQGGLGDQQAAAQEVPVVGAADLAWGEMGMGGGGGGAGRGAEGVVQVRGSGEAGVQAPELSR